MRRHGLELRVVANDVFLAADVGQHALSKGRVAETGGEKQGDKMGETLK
jgi:hypothetical protein